MDGDGDGDLACADCDDTDPTREPLDSDGDGVTTCAALPDCDDGAAQINPYQPDQLGDGLDTNCDGADGIDADGDGFGGVSSGGPDCVDTDPSVTPLTDGDADESSVCDDCDDTDDTRAPSLHELCEDGVDNDCDGDVDTDADLDGDGFTSCVGHCNDASGAAFPGAFDVWGDSLDLNCDDVDGTDGDAEGWAGDALDATADCDDADPTVFPADGDGDGSSLCAGDCDDTDATVYPYAAEVACDGLHSNCGTGSAAQEAQEQDVDGDGYLPCAPYVGTVAGVIAGGDCDDADAGLSPVDADGDGASLCDGDCDDADPNRTPGAAEAACDGFDSDCVFDADEVDLDLDGQLPCEGDCDDGDPAMTSVDLDFDGLSPCGFDGLPGTTDDDCDDADNTVFPGNTELCDGADSDCVYSALEVDDDGDGYVECSPWVGADPNVVGGQDCDDANALNVPSDADGDGTAGCAGDCDETDPAIYPGASDAICDGLDTNCVADPAEVDNDGDGWLGCLGYTGSVAGIVGGGDCDDADAALNLDNVDGDAFSSCGADCDDTDNLVFPGNGDAPCDGLDSDCVLDALEVDDDGDGYVECLPWTGATAGVLGGGDCDDTSAAVVPLDMDGDGIAGCAGDQADGLFVGTSPGDRSGHSIAGAGDVDGDGLDDLLVGAEYNDDGGLNAGTTYLFFGDTVSAGGSWNLSLADASFPGVEASGRSGLCVAGAGDVDGDGLADLLIGAPGTDGGRTYMVLGNTVAGGGLWTLDQSDASFGGEVVGDSSGSSVAGAGDVDGDGLDDLLIGALNNDEGGAQAGKTYLLLSPY